MRIIILGLVVLVLSVISIGCFNQSDEEAVFWEKEARYAREDHAEVLRKLTHAQQAAAVGELELTRAYELAGHWESEAMDARRERGQAQTSVQQPWSIPDLARLFGCVKGGDTSTLLRAVGATATSMGEVRVGLIAQILGWLCSLMGKS